MLATGYRKFTLIVYLSEAKVHQHSPLPLDVKQEVSRTVSGTLKAPSDCLRWLYISMYNAMFVHCGQSLEQRPKVYPDFIMAHRMIESLLAISYRTARHQRSEVPENLGDGNVAARLQSGPDACKR